MSGDTAGARAQPGDRSGGAVRVVAAAAALLLVSAWLHGAFQIGHWGPLTVFVLVSLACVRRRRLSGAPLVAVVALWAWALWCVLSIGWADAPGRAADGAAQQLLYAGLFTLGLTALGNARQAMRLGMVLTAGLGLLVAATLVDVGLTGADAFLAGRLDDPIGYRNGTAVLMVAAFWPLLCFSAARSEHALLRAFALGLGLAALGLAFMTQSRGAALALVAGGAVCLAVGPDRLRRTCLALLCAAGVAAASPVLLDPYERYSDRVAISDGDVTGTLLVLLGVSTLVALLGVLMTLFDRGLRAPERPSPQLRRLVVAAVVGLSLGAATAAVGNPVRAVSDKVDEFKTSDGATESTTRLGNVGGQRYDLWRVALREFEQRPIAGVGINGYGTRYYQERDNDRNLSDPHSLPFKALAETGIVGTLLLGAFAVACLVAVLRRVRQASAERRRWAAATLAVGAAIFAQNLTDWLWIIPGLSGLALLSLAVGIAVLREPQEHQAPPEPATDEGPLRPAISSRGLAGAAAAALLVTASLFVCALLLSDSYVREARGAGTPQGRLDAARDAERFNPWSLTPLFQQAGALEDLGHVEEARVRLGDAVAREPRNFVGHALLGDLELRADRVDVARERYRDALRLNPLDAGLARLAAIPAAP